MQEIGKVVYNTGDLKTIKEKLRNDTTDALSSREELLAFARAAVQRAKAKMPACFDLLPKAEVIVEPLPDYQEKTGNSRYMPASDDGSRPAACHIQLYQPGKQRKGPVESVTFHETYPGHHLQIGVARELGSTHPISKYAANSGFAEGWGRYSETLADEMGLYSSEKNRLSAYAAPPLGMVVDTGIHLKKWTRQQAIEYVTEKISEWTPEQIAAYVDRITVWPGQMTTYGVGEMHFKNLRELAQAKRGARFDIRQFHNKCLENGTIPLNMLSEYIDEWLQKGQGQ